MKQKLLELNKQIASCIKKADSLYMTSMCEILEEMKDLVDQCIEENNEFVDSMYEEDTYDEQY